MLELPKSEIAMFLLVVLICVTAAAVGILQLLAGGQKYKQLLSPLVSLAVALEAVILIFRAVELKAVPLTGLFESMIALTIIFGLIYLFLGIFIQQVWFGSVMAWVILAMIVMAGTVAKPASNPHEVAATPWAIAHGIAMILGGASITFAAASALLHLLGRRKLKRKEVMEVLDRVPNIEKLERMNLLGIRVALVLITIGLISGLGLAVTKSQTLEISVLGWLTDAKIVLIAVVWALLASILVLRRIAVLTGKTTAHITIVAFLLILFAIVGTSVFCETKHEFSQKGVKAVK
ncbi:MAG: cytochrome c biogenesis protein CcsA [Planctomycetota bacterium]